MVSALPSATGTAATPSSTANSKKGSSSSLSVKVEASDDAVMMSIDEGSSNGNKDEVKLVAAPCNKEKITEMKVEASALPDGRDDSHTSERGGGGAGSEGRRVATAKATISAEPGGSRSSSNAGDNGKEAFFGGRGKREDDASPSTQHTATTAAHTTSKKTTRRQSKSSQRGRGRSGGSQQKNQQQKQPPPPGYHGFQGPRGGPMHHQQQQQQPYNYPQHSGGPPRPTYPPHSQYSYPPQGAPDQYYHPQGSGGPQSSHPHYPSSAPGAGPGTGALRHPGQGYSSTSGPAPYHTSAPYHPPNYPQTGHQGPPPQQPHQPSWSQQLPPQQHSQHMGRPPPPYQMQQQQQGGPPLPHAQHPQQGLPPQPSHGYQQQQQQPPYRGHPQHPMQPSYPQGGGSSNSRNRSSTRTGVASERDARSTAKSSKSKNSSKSRDALDTSHCSNSSTASTGSRKNKRTIDGVGRNSSSNAKPPSTVPTPSAGGGAIRRTNSAGSQGSVGLNTSTETPSLTSLAELDSSSSPQKGGPPSQKSSQRPPVIPTRQGSPSPFQSAPPSANLFADDEQLHSIRHHRRNVSTSSTASSLSVGGFSMSSYEGVRASGYGTKEDTDTHMAEASPKRRKGPQPLLPPSGSFDIGGSSSGGNKNTSSRMPHPYSKTRRSHVRQTSNSSYSIDTAGAPARFDHLSMNDDLSKISPGSSYNRNTNKASTTMALSSHHRRNSSGASTITASSRHSTNMFVTLSTSPINHPVVDPGATPVSKNTKHGRSQNIYRERPKEEGREDMDDKQGSDGRQRQQQQDRESIPLDGGGSSSYFSESTSFNKPDTAEDRNDHSLTPTPLTQARSSSSLNTPMIDGGADTPTPSLNPADVMSGSDMMTDEQMLNRHLRGQSFTPLPHVSSENGGGSSCRSGGGGERDANSPTFNPGLSAIAPQLSWSIAGDTAPLGDLADWETDNERQGPPSTGDKAKSSQSPRTSSGAEHRRILSNASQMSTGTRSATISPATMSFWKETDEGSTIRRKNSTVSDTDDNILRLSALSPNSDAMTVDDDLGRNTTPLPIFFDQPTGSGNREERENMTVDNRRSGDSPQHKYHLSGSGGSRTSQQQQRNDPAMSPSRRQQPPQQPPQYGEPEHIHQMFVTNGGRGNNGSGGNNIKLTKPQPQPHPSPGVPSSRSSWDGGNNRGYPQSPAHHPPRMPPTPVYSNEQQQRNDTYVRGGDGRRDGPPPPDYYPSPSSSGNMYGGGGGGMMPIHHGDRVRNLRGRAPPSSHHGAPPLLHIPPHVSSAQHLTSPMGMSGGKHGGGGGMWGQHQHHSGPPQHHHQGGPSRLHHMQSSMELTPSKRKCVPLKPPIPSKFQGDMEKAKAAQVPEFTSLVNFPVHMSQKQSLNLPDGMRCCVMCGQACPCTAAAKNKKGGKGGSSSADGSSGNPNSSEGKSTGVSASVSGGLAPLSNNGQDPAVGKTSGGCGGGGGSQSSSSLLGGGYAIIPTQNKGLCTLCDVNVWVVTQTGLEIKWCKGCKNFRPWAAFGDKGLATKCVRCRERQREKYALQKEEKEKARLSAKASKASAKAAA